MSTLEDLDDLERQEREDKDDPSKKKKDDEQDPSKRTGGDGDTDMKDAEPEEEEEDVLDEEILSLSTQDILTRRRLLENDSRIMKSEFQRLSHEKAAMNEKIKENREKIANNRYAAVRWLEGLGGGLRQES
jgi:26S proteasome regulatory subunit T5